MASFTSTGPRTLSLSHHSPRGNVDEIPGRRPSSAGDLNIPVPGWIQNLKGKKTKYDEDVAHVSWA